MENFTPVSALLGGALIGLGALLLYLFSGRIAGISGISSAALFNKEGRSWRLAFVVGIVVGPLLTTLLVPDLSFSTPALSWQLVIAGLLVGLGTGWGSGCTSGHGICGISRLSGRSVVATSIFMFCGIVTATLLQ